MRRIVLTILLPVFFIGQALGQAQNAYLFSCELTEGTATEIRTLATQGNLEVGCQYAITGYTRGCLVAEKIILTATDSDAFSMDAQIKTIFDNEYWQGRYDLNVNRVVELKDNLGNHVSGRYGNEIDRFPWGKTNIYGNTIQNADVYIDCDETSTVKENEWEANSYTDLRGFQGIFEDNTIESYGRIYMNNATTIDYRRNTIRSYSYNYFNGTDNIIFRQNDFGANSYIRKFTGGRWTLYDSVIATGDIRQYNGTVYNSDITINSGGRLYQRELGTTDVRNTTISDLSYVNLEATSGTTRIWRSNFSTLSYFYIRTGVTAGNRYFYSHRQSGSTFDYRSGTANLNIYNNEQNSNGYVRWDNIAGTYRLYYNNINSRAEHRLNGTTGTHNHYYNNISNYIGRINLTNSTGSYIQRTKLSEGRIDATGGNPKIYYCNLNSTSRATLTNYTGVIQTSTLMSNASLRLTGTGNITGSTLGSGFDFISTNLSHSYISCFGNINHTAGASNNNRGYFHNLVNNIL